jgi:hypothetical protein
LPPTTDKTVKALLPADWLLPVAPPQEVMPNNNERMTGNNNTTRINLKQFENTLSPPPWLLNHGKEYQNRNDKSMNINLGV